MGPGCKAKHKPSAAANDVQARAFIIGEQGITCIEYAGWFDMEEYIGPVTGAAYRFGLDRLRGYIDNRDLAGLLQITEDGQKVFRKWQS